MLFALLTPHPIYYTVFYFLACALRMGVLVYQGKKRGFELIPWFLVIATAFLFFMVGTQVVKFSAADWGHVFQFQPLGHSPGRSVLGGLLLGIPGLLLAQYLLRFRASTLDLFALGAPLGMVVQRMGCHLAGCCFGTPTTAPWGVAYAAEARAWGHQVQQGLIPAEALHSAPVHPTPLYEALGCLLLFAAILFARKRIKAPGNLVVATLAGYAVLRFLLAFVRADSHALLAGLSLVQWVLMLLVPVLGIVFFYREKHVTPTAATPAHVTGRFALLYFLCLALLFFLVAKWLSPLEIITLNLVLTPCLVFIGWKVFVAVTAPQARWATVGLAACSLVLMSQTIPYKAPYDTTRVSTTYLEFGGATGKAEYERFLDDCDGSGQELEFKNTYEALSAGLGKIQEKPNGDFVQFGANVTLGNNTETVWIDDVKAYRNERSLFSVNPFYQYDWRLVGLGAGFHAGNFGLYRHTIGDGTTNETWMRETTILPAFYVRVGAREKFMGEFSFAYGNPSMMPFNEYRLNMVLPLGRANRAMLAWGTASSVGLFASGSIPLGKSATLKPYIGFGPGLLNSIGKSISILGDTYNLTQTEGVVGSLTLNLKLGR